MSHPVLAISARPMPRLAAPGSASPQWGYEAGTARLSQNAPLVLGERRRDGDVLLGENPPRAARVADEHLVVRAERPVFLRPARYVGHYAPSGRHLGEALTEVAVEGDPAVPRYEVELVAETGAVGGCDEHEVDVAVPGDIVGRQERRQAACSP